MGKYKIDFFNKKMIIIIFCILFLLLAICIGVIRKISIDKAEENDDELILTDPVYISEEKGKIYPEKSFQFVYTFSGEQKITDELYEEIYDFEKYIHLLAEKFQKSNSKDIENYFSANTHVIKNKTGITTLEEFEKFLEKINDFSSDAILEKSEFMIDEKVVNEDYTICPISFSYDNGSQLVFDLYISNKRSVTPATRFLAE